MPITDRSAPQCFKKFRDHLGPLLAATLGATHQVIFEASDNPLRKTLSLGPTGARAGVRLDGERGAFFLSLQQDLETVKEGKTFCLKTRGYRYAVSANEDELGEALMRWEYVQAPPGKQWCRHHFQIGKLSQKALTIPLNDNALDLNRLHTPTGLVLIEYVLRFVLTDMGVKAASDNWEKVLADSETEFFTKFSSRTSGA